jgi:hypothetical protein
MGRPFYPHEADDPDLDWLVSNFLFERPNYLPVEGGTLPLILIPYREATGEPQPKREVKDVPKADR